MSGLLLDPLLTRLLGVAEGLLITALALSSSFNLLDVRFIFIFIGENTKNRENFNIIEKHENNLSNDHCS